MSLNLPTAARRDRVLLILGVLLVCLLLPARSLAAGYADHSRPAGTDPLAGDRFWVQPNNLFDQEVDVLRSEGKLEWAAQVSRIATEPNSQWFTGPVNLPWLKSIAAQAIQADETPVYVMYDLPWRGCGQPGAGGAANPAQYRQVVRTITRGIGQDKLVMLIEPDALPEVTCLSRHRQTMYYRLIRYALRHFSRDRNAAIYLDAGHPGWEPAATMAHRLMRVTRNPRVGFSLNVSNYVPTGQNAAYGTIISRLTDGKHFVVDTSRNGGHVNDNQWCNPSGAKIGAAPTSRTGNPLLDAELWIKPPGESDGTCNGGPPAGEFWLNAALAQTRRRA